MKFNAAIHGIDLDKETKKAKSVMFPHPDTFKNLSDEEKQKKTEEMMQAHRIMLPKQMRMK